MTHELSITVERDGKHFIESSVEPGKVLEGPFDTGQEALERSIARSDEFEESTGSTIFIEGLGLIEIEGDVPSEQELRAILEAIGDPEDEGDPTVPPIPEPVIPESMFPTSGRAPLSGEGPLGLMPAETRSGIRRSVEKQSGLAQLVTEISPSAVGTGVGAARGLALTAAIPIPGARVVGALGGAMIGGLLGETVAQETGIAPKSDLNLALSAGGPLLGPVVGGTLKGIRRGTGFAITRGLPAARVARARNVMSRAVSEFERIGTTILNKTSGVSSLPASELYNAAARAKIRIPVDQLKSTRAEIDALIKKFTPISDLPDVGQSLKALERVKSTMLSNPKGILLSEFIEARSFLGFTIGQLASASGKGGVKLNVSKRVFAKMNDDLDEFAKSPFRKGRQARLAQSAIKRAKLEFAVGRMQQKVAQFTQRNVKGLKPDDVMINFKSLSKWLDDVTNPQHVKFDKNFNVAMKEHIPTLKKRIDALVGLGGTGSPGGAGSIVLRGQSAKIGRSLVNS